MSDWQQELSQLKDMGIPPARARAALVRSKGDVMDAATRVADGEFDDIPSDAEDSDSGDNHLATNDESIDIMSSGDEAEDFHNPVDSDDGYGDMEMDMEDEIGARGQDPYAGVFFPKDRVEEIVEPREQVQLLTVPVANDPGAPPVSVRILSRAEWMSGCPEGKEQSFLFQLYEQVSEERLPCASDDCSHSFPRQAHSFFALHPDFPSYEKSIAAQIELQCPYCGATTCAACGKSCGSSSSKGKQTMRIQNEALFHCAEIQGIIVGVGLHMIEKAFTPDTSSPSPPPLKKRKKGMMSRLLSGASNEDDIDDDDGEEDSRHWGGKGKTAPRGTGYDGHVTEDDSGRKKVMLARAQQDKRVTDLLRQVSLYLPSFKRQCGTFTSDGMVHPTTLAHVRRRSGFVVDLLSSDSLLDMTNRAELYNALFEWLEIVSNHEALASMLAMPSMRPSSERPGPDTNSVTVTYCAGSSPRELLETIVIQATAALKGLDTAKVPEPEAPPPEQAVGAIDIEPHNDEYEPEDLVEKAVRAFCKQILVARDRIDKQLRVIKGDAFMERMLETLPGRSKPAFEADTITHNGTDHEELTSIYEKWAVEKRFEWCSLLNPADETEYLHAYREEAKLLTGTVLPGRLASIATELGSLAQNVPSSWGASIFLRVDDERIDLIKAMLVGPAGTPYQNGCFFFDIFLPQAYNKGPPQVKSMTTNGGRYRYNPNLYADGKVCLSLLGTWSGPSWISGQSTLLQVLISIQSLIFCDEPYINEPGWSNYAGSSASKAYSANVRRMTIIDAMANNLKNPPFPFEEEVKMHFKLKAKEIREQIKQWEELDDGQTITSDMGEITYDRIKFDKAAGQLRELLDGIV